MALGRYSKLEERKSQSTYFSTVTIVVFVALCLVGVWMMTSSSVVPVQNSDDVSAQDSKNELKTQMSETSESNDVTTGSGNDISNGSDDSSNQSGSSESNETNNASVVESNTSSDEVKSSSFEDNPGNLPTDATKKDVNIQEEKNTVTQDVKTTGENQAEIEVKPEEEKKEIQAEIEPKPEEEKKDEPKFEDASNGVSENVEEKKETKEPKIEDKSENKPGEEISGVKNDNGNDDNAEKKPEENVTDTKGDEKESGKIDEKAEDKKDNEISNEIQDKVPPVQSSIASDAPKTTEDSVDNKDNKGSDEKTEPLMNEVLPSAAHSELLNETTTQNGAFSTQAIQSKNEKISKKSFKPGYSWKVCNTSAGPDYIPCLDNPEAIKHLRTTMHYEHRERHCPDEAPTCIVPLPPGYQRSIKWPTSREKIWYRNVPHTKLAEYKGHQNWVKANGEYLTFPGGGTQFTHGALHYIDFIQQSVPEIAWGKHTRVVLDVGCGVASFGGFLFERDVLTMSFAPKDEHEAQVQFALERGIPAISAVMGTKRLPFPSRVFDAVHCARCRVPWHIEGGKLLLELNRMLRPGGYFVWSATPVYQKIPEDVEIWEAMKKLTKSMCWDLVSITRDRLNKVGIAIYQKPTSNDCYEQRQQDEPPLCKESDDADAAWNVPLQTCMHKVPTDATKRGSQWPELWPNRLEKSPYWLLSSQVGVYGKPAPEDFTVDFQHWKRVVTKTYLNGMGIDWSGVRNVMDMRAVYGGFAAALKELNVWVMNIISIDAPDTLPVIYERGLFGIYHDWCESFSTYPRSYDLLHADHLFSKIKTKCGLPALVAEVDRILRPEGKLIVRDNMAVIGELQVMLKAMQYEIRMTYSRDKEGLLCVKKTMWRPTDVETLSYAVEQP